MSYSSYSPSGRIGTFGKLMALLLVFLLIMAPLRYLRADEESGGEGQQTGQGSQEGGQNTQNPPAGEETPPPAGTDNPDPSGDPQVDPGDEDAANPPADVPPQPNDSKYSNKRVVLAKTDESSGALNYSYPLSFAPGRNNLTPDLALSYNSQAGTRHSIVGDGWSLSIPTIERVNKQGVSQLYAGDFFNSSLSGELVTTGSGQWRARVDNGDFSAYAFDGTQWTMTDKNGTRYIFGATAGSRQDDPADASRIYKWFLEEVRDTNDNFIRYEYIKDQGQVYPATIRYTGHGADNGIFSISFSRSLNNDSGTYYDAGFPITTRYRLTQIDGSVDGVLAKRYSLQYVTGDNGNRALLSSLTESGWSNGTLTALPATTFQYGQVTGNAWPTRDQSWSAPVDLRLGVYIMDVNGDSLPDLVQSYQKFQGPLLQGVYLNNGHAWTASSQALPPIAFANQWPGTPDDQGVREMDFDGDGRGDLVQNIYANIGFNIIHAYRNTGSGWEDVTDTWGPPVAFANYSGTDTEGRIADLNGDGLPDLISTSSTDGNRVFINTGHGWSDESSQWNLPFRLYGGAVIGDLNGDRLVDVMVSRYHGQGQDPIKVAYINNGKRGWIESAAFTPPAVFSGDNDMLGVQGIDVNNDGLLDLIQRIGGANVYYNAWLNTGNGWQFDNHWLPSEPFVFDNSGTDTATRLADINGDGSVDIIRAYQQPYDPNVTTWAYLNTQKDLDILKQINLPQGGSNDISYRASAEYAGANGLLNLDLPMTLRVVSRLAQSDSFGYSSATDYEYAFGNYYFNTALDRRFGGFGRVTATDSDGNRITTSYHGGSQNEPSLGQYQDHIAKAGKPYRSETRDANNVLYARTIQNWDRFDAGNGRSFIKLARKVEQSFAPGGTHRDSAETYAYDNVTGNQTGVQSWGEVTGADDGTFSDIGSDAFATTVTYAANMAAGIFGLPAMQQTIDQDNHKVSESRSYYDNLPLGQAAAGNQTKQEQWKSGSSYINSQKSYSAYGLPLSETDPRGKITSYQYDAASLYPARVTNPAGQATDFLYDYASGQARQVSDPNGAVLRTVYDGLGRPIEEWQPDRSNPASSVLKASYEYVDASGAVRLKQRTYLDNANIVDSYTYFDGFGRKIQERSQAAAANQFNVRDFAYAENGQLHKESLPYVSSGSARTTPTATAALYTTYAYDALKRPLSAQNAVGTTLTAYSDWKTSITDADGKKKDLLRDAYGNLLEVSEHDGRTVYTTAYEWNGLKKLTKLTDAMGNVRHFQYDGLGRATRSEDLHAPADTTYGFWLYAYDPAGNLSEKTDPMGKTVSYAYDDINRMLSEDSSTASGIEATYTFDNCPNGIGRLCASDNGYAATQYMYDILGGVSSEQRTIEGTDYITNRTYDRAGNPLTIENPDGSQVRYGYDSAGQAAKVERKEADDDKFKDVLSSVTYNALGLPLVLTYGNGAVTANTYDTAHLYRLQQRVTTANNTALQDLTYAYDPVGNITRIVDASATQSAKTVEYLYDDLHRLIQATTAPAGLDQPPLVEAFAYDAIGNIISKSDVGAYLYEGNQPGSYANPHAVTSINGEEYAYDANGNMMTTPDGKRFHWDYNNRLTAVDTPEGTSNYTYDPSGQRISAATPSGTMYYPSATYSTDNVTADKHIFLGDTAIATIRGMGKDAILHSIHADHLTGSNVTTDATANLEELTDYTPFGSIRLDEKTGDFAEKRKYTGHEYDEETGLTYANARYYDAKIGRWLSQDSVFLSIANQNDIQNKTQMQYAEYLANPQVLNSYSYVANNPLKYKDANGDFLFLVVPIIVYAPVWVPIAITTGAAIGAGVATWYEAHAINNLAHGNTTAANKNIDKVETTLNITGIGVGGIMGAEELLVNAGGNRSTGIRPNKLASQTISQGHAFDAHIDEFENLGIKTKSQFQKYVESVMNNPSETRSLDRGRTAYWEKSTETVVIKDPGSRDMGTAFRPSPSVHGFKTNYDYFKKGLK